MIEWKLGRVCHITDSQAEERMQQVTVVMQDGSSAQAVHYTDVHKKLSIGDQVLLNTTAESLCLGSGGVHFVHAVAPSSGELTWPGSDRVSRQASEAPGHIMKLRYTSLQTAVLAAEEQISPHHETFRTGPHTLQGMPVLVGELHSMFPAAVCFIRQRQHEAGACCRIAYIMTDGGALPLAFSKHVSLLSRLGWLAGTVTYGHAYGGDVETVNKYTALLAAKHVLHADIAIAAMGPGSVGTGTRFGFSGMEVGELLNAAAALHGRPVIIPRISFADPRERHFGLSHHTTTVLRDIAGAGMDIALPMLSTTNGAEAVLMQSQIAEAGLDQRHKIHWIPISTDEVRGELIQTYPQPISTMGRGLIEDPHFFAGIEAAAALAWNFRPSCENGGSN